MGALRSARRGQKTPAGPLQGAPAGEASKQIFALAVRNLGTKRNYAHRLHKKKAQRMRAVTPEPVAITSIPGSRQKRRNGASPRKQAVRGNPLEASSLKANKCPPRGKSLRLATSSKRAPRGHILSEATCSWTLSLTCLSSHNRKMCAWRLHTKCYKTSEKLNSES